MSPLNLIALVSNSFDPRVNGPSPDQPPGLFSFLPQFWRPLTPRVVSRRLFSPASRQSPVGRQLATQILIQTLRWQQAYGSPTILAALTRMRAIGVQHGCLLCIALLKRCPQGRQVRWL